MLQMVIPNKLFRCHRNFLSYISIDFKKNVFLVGVLLSLIIDNQ